MNAKRFYTDRWLRIPLSHRLSRDPTFRPIAPNPKYVSAQAAGVQTDEPPRNNLFKRTATHLLVPRGLGEQHLPARIKLYDHRAWRPVRFPESEIELDSGKHRGQKAWVRKITSELKEQSGIVAQAETGFGKTVCACEVIFRTKQRTLILVHTEFLLEQWIERLIAHGLTREQIGVIHQDKCEFGGRYKVSVAMIKSLLSRRGKYPRELYRAFGLVVIDEVHRMGATTFRQTITLFNSRYRLGISATPKRKDKCEQVFTAHIGPLSVIGRKRAIKPKIVHRIIKHQIIDNSLKAWRDGGMKDNVAKIDSYLTTHRGRNRRIIAILVNAIKNKRRVLLLTSRRAHIELLTLQLSATIDPKTGAKLENTIDALVGWLVGGRYKSKAAKKDAEAQKKRRILLGTYQFAEEGLDIPALDVMILATPRSRVVQAVGRILRELPDKKQPVVVDFMDTGIGLTEGMAWARWTQYKKSGWASGTPKGLTQSHTYRARRRG
jgi:superfamily II DNA or RNA helicase